MRRPALHLCGGGYKSRDGLRAAVASRALRIALALGALYVIWGTTYYGIREAVDEIPPFTMAALRFLAPGLALLAWCKAQGVPPAGRAAWSRAAILGGLMLTVGNGVVSFVETDMPSGIAALLVTAVPMWTVVLDWALGGNRPTRMVASGLALGLAGVGLLVSRDQGGWDGAGFNVGYMLLVLLGSAAWALGSLRSRKGDAPASFWQDLALQMLAGGAFLAVLGLAAGEWTAFDLRAVSWQAWAWVAYLSVFGSIVALGCFLWLLRTTTPAVATTYAFVNPAVAVLVGALLGSEPLTPWILAATAVIVAGVALIVAGKRRPLSPANPPTQVPRV